MKNNFSNSIDELIFSHKLAIQNILLTNMEKLNKTTSMINRLEYREIQIMIDLTNLLSLIYDLHKEK